MPNTKRNEHEEDSGTYHYARGLSGGAIAGIAIGVILVAAAIGGFFWFRRRRNRQRQRQFPDPSVNSYSNDFVGTAHNPRNVPADPVPIQVDEGARERKADSDNTVSSAKGYLPEVQVDTTEYKYQAYRPPSPPELSSDERHEVSGAPPAYELHAADVNTGPHYPSTCIPMSRANTGAGNS